MRLLLTFTSLFTTIIGIASAIKLRTRFLYPKTKSTTAKQTMSAEGDPAYKGLYIGPYANKPNEEVYGYVCNVTNYDGSSQKVYNEVVFAQEPQQYQIIHMVGIVIQKQPTPERRLERIDGRIIFKDWNQLPKKEKDYENRKEYICSAWSTAGTIKHQYGVEDYILKVKYIQKYPCDPQSPFKGNRLYGRC